MLKADWSPSLSTPLPSATLCSWVLRDGRHHCNGQIWAVAPRRGIPGGALTTAAPPQGCPPSCSPRDICPWFRSHISVLSACDFLLSFRPTTAHHP